MTDLKLDFDEEIILQSTEVERYGIKEQSLDEMVLTNKYIICVYGKSTGLFSKPEMVVEKIPLSTIKVVNGRAQVMSYDNDDYGLGLQVLFVSGHREHFLFYDEKKELPRWEKKICSLIGKDIVSSSSYTEESDIDGKPHYENTAFESKENVVRFCSYCGTKLDVGGRFCQNCGEAVVAGSVKSDAPNSKESDVEENSIKENPGERKTVYEGEIHKCPNCGDIIDAYETICEACGYEIRGRKAVSVVRELALKLEKTNDRKAKEELIRNFYIPNTKEDIYEFFILATSNIKIGSSDSKAWFAKLEQAYQKAQITLGNTNEFEYFKSLYAKAEKENKTNFFFTLAKSGYFWALVFAAIGGIMCIFNGGSFISSWPLLAAAWIAIMTMVNNDNKKNKD